MAEVHNFPASAPYNAVAEQAVLGAILADNSVYDRLIGTLKATDFHEPLHAELYEAIENLIRDERRADLVTLTPTIKDKKIGEADALSYVQTLPKFAPTSPEELSDYAREITRDSPQRQILATATMLGREAGR